MSKVTYADKKDFVVNPTVEEPNKITAGNMNELKKGVNENELAIDKKIKKDNVAFDIVFNTTRKAPATKLIVQMQDASGKVCYVEASAENTYLADGTTVQSRLANAVYFA